MTILSPVHNIKPPLWMQNPNLIKVLDTLNTDDLNARMVGGCIRNEFMNKDVYDIDIACKYDVNRTIEILNNASICTIPTGIKHGTITAHINGQNFEITMLRKDVETDGRHANVANTSDWTEDAKRRDFTINALYADRDGSIYDPLDTGLHDLQKHIVRFIGNAEQRIGEDALRILRFYRFYADYHHGNPDSESLLACQNNKNKIQNLSDERIYDELFKTLKSDNAYRAAKAMMETNIFDFKDAADIYLTTLVTLQNQLKLSNTISRFLIAFKNEKYIKNNKEKQFINKLNYFNSTYNGNIKLALYHYDRDVVLQGLLIKKARGETVDDLIISNAMNFTIPELPITATDIMGRFKLPEGRPVGEKIKAGETLWIKSNFTFKRDEILDQL